MNNVQPMFDFYRSQLSSTLCKTIKPMSDCLGLDVFVYTKVDEDGSFFQVGNYPELFEHYWWGPLYRANPHIRHPVQYQSGTYVVSEDPTRVS